MQGLTNKEFFVYLHNLFWIRQHQLGLEDVYGQFRFIMQINNAAIVPKPPCFGYGTNNIHRGSAAFTIFKRLHFLDRPLPHQFLGSGSLRSVIVADAQMLLQVRAEAASGVSSRKHGYYFHRSAPASGHLPKTLASGGGGIGISRAAELKLVTSGTRTPLLNSTPLSSGRRNGARS